MPAPPAKSEISAPYPNPSNAVARGGLGKLWETLFGVGGLLGSTGNPAEARTALGVSATSAVVLKTGDTMTGDLAIQKASPTLSLDKTSFAQNVLLNGKSGTVLQWSIALGDASGGYYVNQYNGSGAFLRQVFGCTAAGAVTVNGTQITISAPDLRITGIATTASAANLYQDPSGGNVYRSTSSLRYKKNVEDVDAARSEGIYALRPVWYRSNAKADPEEWSWYGLIAEEVAAVEPRLVHWAYPDSAYETVERQVSVGEGEDGEPIYRTESDRVLVEGAQKVPDGVQYERLSVLLLAELQKLRKRVEALESAAGN